METVDTDTAPSGRPAKRMATVKADTAKTAQEAEKAQCKAARMVRNRYSAKASRDRKRAYTEQLESRVKQLEELVTGLRKSDRSSDSSDLQLENDRLSKENTDFKTRLELLEKENTTLRNNLATFETKFTTLESLLNRSQTPDKALSPVPSVDATALPSSDGPGVDDSFPPGDFSIDELLSSDSKVTSASSTPHTPQANDVSSQNHSPDLSPSSFLFGSGTSLVAREDSLQWMMPARSRTKITLPRHSLKCQIRGLSYLLPPNLLLRILERAICRRQRRLTTLKRRLSTRRM